MPERRDITNQSYTPQRTEPDRRGIPDLPQTQVEPKDVKAESSSVYVDPKIMDSSRAVSKDVGKQESAPNSDGSKGSKDVDSESAGSKGVGPKSVDSEAQAVGPKGGDSKKNVGSKDVGSDVQAVDPRVATPKHAGLQNTTSAASAAASSPGCRPKTDHEFASRQAKLDVSGPLAEPTYDFTWDDERMMAIRALALHPPTVRLCKLTTIFSFQSASLFVPVLIRFEIIIGISEMH